MRVAIVNDLKLAVEALKRVLRGAPDVELAWVAENGAQAVEWCRRDVPDVVLMDLMMPVMDGVEATRRIMKETPCAILVVTATVEGHATKVFQAMGFGALDAVPTPTLGPGGKVAGAEALLAKLVRIGKLVGRGTEAGIAAEAVPIAMLARDGACPPLVLVGSSTGGPVALKELLEGIGPNSTLALVLVQHVDEQFAVGLAEWLTSQGGVPVSVATEGVRPEAGRAWLAGTNDHLVMRPDGTLAYTPHPREYAYRPSVDVLFSSVRHHWPRTGVAAVLTGMGRDGAKGLLELRQAGWLTFAQDQQSSVLYGMPKAAAELDAAMEVMAPAAMGRRLAEFGRQRR